MASVGWLDVRTECLQYCHSLVLSSRYLSRVQSNTSGRESVPSYLTQHTSLLHSVNMEDDDHLLGDAVSFNFDVTDTDVMQDAMVSADDDSGVIIQHMDIREPLVNLKRGLERKLKTDLSEFDFWLQDRELLEETMTLVDHTVQGEGRVQINLDMKTDPETGRGKINILDVLKPVMEDQSEEERSEEEETEVPGPVSPVSVTGMVEGGDVQCVTRWVVCTQFRKEQEQLAIPTDPAQWSKSNVQHWLRWAMKTFSAASIDPIDWNMSGADLCETTQDQFKLKVQVDPNDLFWTHLELLRKCKFVAVVQKTPATGKAGSGRNVGPRHSSPHTAAVRKKKPVTLGVARVGLANNIPDGSPGNRSGNNGQVQLWQFLLELLTDREHREVIHWLGQDGEFKLNNPEIVAQLWGARKNKPNMNYEKLSRALRYYYDGDMICKVHGKRFVYKFVCDLKELLGYSACELSRLVEEAERRCAERAGEMKIYM